MLTELINLTSYDDMRKFVMDLEDITKTTELIKEMQNSKVRFTNEVLTASNALNLNDVQKLDANSGEDISFLCYKKLLWVKKVNPVALQKIDRIIQMFTAVDEV